MIERVSNAGGKPHRRRGRPALDGSRNLSNELICAVEQGLRQKSHLDLTSREIASAAGTNPGMIHYYYDSKDGLIDAALETFCRDIADTLRDLKVSLEADSRDATGAILRAWLSVHERHKGISSIVFIESFRPYSPVWRYYSSRMSKRTFGRMQDILRALVEKGYYREDLDVELAAFSIFSVVHSPMIVGQIMSGMGHDVERLLPAWFGQAVEMLDRQYRRP